ncbi:MAG: thioredoxin family protein [Mucilaginibacter sp.]
MKRVTICLIVVLAFVFHANAQRKPPLLYDPPLYNPRANARADIKKAVALAAREHKHVFVQVGGNWCIWCMRFHDLLYGDTTLKRIITDYYVMVHVNYSDENKNMEVMKDLGHPGRFGYPVFVILDGEGNRIHTQNSAYLEEGQGHSKKKVQEFLMQWTYAAVHPDLSKN